MATPDTTAKDRGLIWSLACNCLLHEEDPGPNSINIGSQIEPKMVSRGQAWRDLYARLLAERVGADIARIDATAAVCRDELADTHRPEHWQRIYESRHQSGDPNAAEVFTEQGQHEIREVWECAIDLCEHAAQMVREAGAAENDKARQRFLAGLKHQNTVDVLGAMPGVAQVSAADLIERLRELD
jgi:hypothetical protein